MALFLILLTITMSLIYYYVLLTLLTSPMKILRKRIQRFMPSDSVDVYEEALLIRLLKPLKERVGKVLVRFTPQKYKDNLTSILLNLNNRYSLQEILMMKFLLLFFCIIASIVYTISSGPPSILLILMMILLFFAPDFILKVGLKKRRQLILHELPIFIELLSVILEGGLSFDNAIVKICQRKEGELYKELKLFLKDIKMGSTREDALKKVAERLKLKDFDSLVRALVQGEKMGIGILQTIKIQAEQIRNNQRQAVKEEAMKIPIKLLFPLVLFIFPPIFIVILGPGIINIFENLL